MHPEEALLGRRPSNITSQKTIIAKNVCTFTRGPMCGAHVQQKQEKTEQLTARFYIAIIRWSRCNRAIEKMCREEVKRFLAATRARRFSSRHTTGQGGGGEHSTGQRDGEGGADEDDSVGLLEPILSLLEIVEAVAVVVLVEKQ